MEDRCSGQRTLLTMKGWEGKAPKVRMTAGDLFVICITGTECYTRYTKLQQMKLTALFRIVCCIYHRPKKVDESSDESSSDSSSSDSDSDSEPERKRKVGGGKDDCNHNHGHDHDHSHSHKHSRRTNGKKKRTPSPNAYEKIPKQKPKDTKQEVSK